MIYITGDTHGDFNRIESFCHTHHTKKEDILVILGDAGINYYLDERDILLKERLQNLPITFFLVYGNHEQRPYLIPTYEEQIWKGGAVYIEPSYPHLIFAKDRAVYDFDGKSVVVIGGAYSIDKHIRNCRGQAWFPYEQPSHKIKRFVEAQLHEQEWKVDLVLTHTCPLKFMPKDILSPHIPQHTIDKSTEIWLDMIEQKLSYQMWFFGHYHIDRFQNNHTILFQEILNMKDCIHY